MPIGKLDLSSSSIETSFSGDSYLGYAKVDRALTTPNGHLQLPSIHAQHVYIWGNTERDRVRRREDGKEKQTDQNI